MSAIIDHCQFAIRDCVTQASGLIDWNIGVTLTLNHQRRHTDGCNNARVILEHIERASPPSYTQKGFVPITSCKACVVTIFCLQISVLIGKRQQNTGG